MVTPRNHNKYWYTKNVAYTEVMKNSIKEIASKKP